MAFVAGSGLDRAQPERGNGPRHREVARAQDIDAVDLANARRAHTDPRTRQQSAVARLAHVSAQQFGIVQSLGQFGGKAGAVDNHRRGDDRAGERPASSLVNAAH